MGRGTNEENTISVAVLTPSPRVQSENRSDYQRRLKKLFTEPAHTDTQSINATYLAKGEDPEEVFNSLPGSDQHYWLEQLDGWVDQSTGYKIKINPEIDNHENPWPHDSTMSVYMDIADRDGELIGDFGIHVYLKPDYQTGLQLGPAELRYYPRESGPVDKTDVHMGRGFGSRLVKHIERAARKAEVQEMSVHAVSVGSYAWATMGFDFDPRQVSSLFGFSSADSKPETAQKAVQWQRTDLGNSMMEHMQEIIQPMATNRVGAYDELAQLVNDFSDKINNGESMTLYEMSQWGRETTWYDENGRKTWLGQQALLASSDWHGVKFL